MIELKNVSKKFKIPHERRETFRDHFLNIFQKLDFEEFSACNNISFQIKKGEWIGVIGANGAGKSTLLKILAGIYVPDSGEILISPKIKMVPLLSLGIGFDPELSVTQNIILTATILGLSSIQIRQKFNEILDFAELKKFKDAKLKNLSSGMTARLAFSIAMTIDGDLFLLDEVFAVGDAAFAKKCENVFADLRQKKKTVVFVSHNLAKINKFCDRTILLKDGSIKKIGKTGLVLAEYDSEINFK
jgi:lipopolysaccharide transport system ATP-binding protein